MPSMSCRMRCLRATALVVFAPFALVLGPGLAQAPGVSDRLPSLEQRLESLDPAQPNDYLDLAEEVAAESFTESDIRLAQRLAVHASRLSRAEPATETMQTSALLLLIDLEDPGPRRDALLGILAQVDATTPIQRLVRRPPPSGDADLRLEAAVAVGAVRAGDGHAARQRLEDQRVAAVLDGFAGVYPAASGRPLAAYLASLAEDWPCPECGNDGARTNRERRRELELCPNCRGDPGPVGAIAARVALLRLEAALLSGEATAWSRRLNASSAPARVVLPGDLAALYAVDPDATVFRDGAWVRP